MIHVNKEQPLVTAWQMIEECINTCDYGNESFYADHFDAELTFDDIEKIKEALLSFGVLLDNPVEYATDVDELFNINLSTCCFPDGNDYDEEFVLGNAPEPYAVFIACQHDNGEISISREDVEVLFKKNKSNDVVPFTFDSWKNTMWKVTELPCISYASYDGDRLTAKLKPEYMCNL